MNWVLPSFQLFLFYRVASQLVLYFNACFQFSASQASGEGTHQHNSISVQRYRGAGGDLGI